MLASPYLPLCVNQNLTFDDSITRTLMFGFYNFERPPLLLPVRV